MLRTNSTMLCIYYYACSWNPSVTSCSGHPVHVTDDSTWFIGAIHWDGFLTLHIELCHMSKETWPNLRQQARNKITYNTSEVHISKPQTMESRAKAIVVSVSYATASFLIICRLPEHSASVPSVCNTLLHLPRGSSGERAGSAGSDSV